MTKRTSFTSNHLLGLTILICIFGLNIAIIQNDKSESLEWEPEPEPEIFKFFQRYKRQTNANNELIFSGRPMTTVNPFFPQENTIENSNNNSNNNNNNNNDNGNNQSGQLVFINNRPTIATMAPFTGRTTASPQYITCFNSCRTTPEYNPICGSDQELYFNEQKFNCARSCGADIQIVRRGSCQGLFPMMRG